MYNNEKSSISNNNLLQSLSNIKTGNSNNASFIYIDESSGNPNTQPTNLNLAPVYYTKLKVTRYNENKRCYEFDEIIVDKNGLHPINCSEQFMKLKRNCFEANNQLVFIGRRSDVHVVLRYNQNISRYHCSIDFSKYLPDFGINQNERIVQLLYGKYSSGHFLNTIHTDLFNLIYSYFKKPRKISICDLKSRFGTYTFINSYRKIKETSYLQIGSLIFLKIEKLCIYNSSNLQSREYRKFQYKYYAEVAAPETTHVDQYKMFDDVLGYMSIQLNKMTPEGLKKRNYVIPLLYEDLQGHSPKIYTIGRDQTCSIRINEEISISRLQTSVLVYRSTIYVMDGGLDFTQNNLSNDELNNIKVTLDKIDKFSTKYISLYCDYMLSCPIFRKSLNGTWFNIQNSSLNIEEEYEVDYKEAASWHEDFSEVVDPCKFKLGDTIFELDHLYQYDETFYNNVYSMYDTDEWLKFEFLDNGNVNAEGFNGYNYTNTGLQNQNQNHIGYNYNGGGGDVNHINYTNNNVYNNGNNSGNGYGFNGTVNALQNVNQNNYNNFNNNNRYNGIL